MDDVTVMAKSTTWLLSISLNERNQADRRVLELFREIQAVRWRVWRFDEVLGSIESGIDFETHPRNLPGMPHHR